MPSDDATLVERFESETAAEAAYAALEAAGIGAVVSVDDCGGMLPCLQELRGVALRAAPEDVPLARAILAEQIVAPEPSADNTAENP